MPETATGCSQDVRNGLWRAAPTYGQAGLFVVGFSLNIPSFNNVKSRAARLSELTTDSAALVLYGYAFFARTVDQMHFNITGPTGFAIEHTQGIEKHNRICFAYLENGAKKRAGLVVSIAASLPCGATTILLPCVKPNLRPQRDPNPYPPCHRPSAIFQ